MAAAHCKMERQGGVGEMFVVDGKQLTTC